MCIRDSFINCLVDKEALEAVKAMGALSIKSTSGLAADVKQLAHELNQQQTQILIDSMLNVYLSLIHI